MRLERIPGGLRLGEWTAGALQRRAPVLPVGDLAELVTAAAQRRVIAGRDADALREALDTPAIGSGGRHGASPGRSGDLSEELRLERLDDDSIRIARWVLRPGSGWVLHEAPTMYPARRYAEAIARAARDGAL